MTHMTIHVHVFFEDFSHLIYACVIHFSYCTEVRSLCISIRGCAYEQKTLLI